MSASATSPRATRSRVCGLTACSPQRPRSHTGSDHPIEVFAVVQRADGGAATVGQAFGRVHNRPELAMAQR
jgi:hypothetical protein